jgi:hypothetical protein
VSIGALIVSADIIVEMKEINLALRVLEKVGGYVKPDAGVATGDKEVCGRLVPEYYVLRTALVSRVRPLISDSR